MTEWNLFNLDLWLCREDPKLSLVQLTTSNAIAKQLLSISTAQDTTGKMMGEAECPSLVGECF